MKEPPDSPKACSGACGSCPRAASCPTRRAAASAPVLLAGARPEGSARDCDGVGFAVDIGSTTLALALYDLRTGTLLAEKGCINPQTAVSPDVVGRIAAAGSPSALQRMQRLVTDALASLLASACSSAGIQPASVVDGVMTGNTVMLHLLTARDPTPLGQIPFRASWLAGCDDVLIGRPVWLPPCIGAFVGADHVCALLSADFTPKGPPALLCDLGTNAEVALRANGTIYATSTAAGPAFEVAGVRGSEILDAIARLLKSGVISETGASQGELPFLAPGIRLANSHIRAVQLAKAAVAAGISVMLDEAGVAPDELESIYLAGGFGCALNPSSAAVVGLIPNVSSARTFPLGNAALAGAARLLLFPELRPRVVELARSVKLVELGGNEDFSDRFIDAMTFGPSSFDL